MMSEHEDEERTRDTKLGMYLEKREEQLMFIWGLAKRRLFKHYHD
jgi:hypothetical protein